MILHRLVGRDPYLGWTRDLWKSAPRRTTLVLPKSQPHSNSYSVCDPGMSHYCPSADLVGFSGKIEKWPFNCLCLKRWAQIKQVNKRGSVDRLCFPRGLNDNIFGWPKCQHFSGKMSEKFVGFFAGFFSGKVSIFRQTLKPSKVQEIKSITLIWKRMVVEVNQSD